jgi:hypothetical protein
VTLLPLFPKMRLLSSLLYPILVYMLWRRGVPRVGMTDPAQRNRMLSLLCLLPLLELFVVGIEPHQAATSLLRGIHIGIGPLHSPLLHRYLFPDAPFHHAPPPFTLRLLPLALLLTARLGGMFYALIGSLAGYLCAAWRIYRLPGRWEEGVIVLRAPGWAAFTFGLLRPRVFISESVWNSPHRAAVLAHERGHARRRDPLRRFLVRATQRLLWYLPFWHNLADQIDFEAERACDLRACSLVGRPAYARALLAFVDQVGGDIAPKGLAPAFASHSFTGLEEQGLLARARFLADLPEDSTPRLFWPLFALFYCLIMLLA